MTCSRPWACRGPGGETRDVPGRGGCPLERLVRAYGAFAMRGQVVEPVLIERITTAEGEELFKAPAKSKARRAITEPTAAAVALMLQRAVNEGTGTALRSKHGVRMTVGGKTGTSQDYADAWFVATQPGLVVGTWVGAMDPNVHFQGGDGTGSRLALPVVGSVLRGLERSAELRKRCATLRLARGLRCGHGLRSTPPDQRARGVLEDLFDGRSTGAMGPSRTTPNRRSRCGRRRTNRDSSSDCSGRRSARRADPRYTVPTLLMWAMGSPPHSQGSLAERRLPLVLARSWVPRCRCRYGCSFRGPVWSSSSSS